MDIVELSREIGVADQKVKTHLVHRLPGRTRLRVAKAHRSPAAMRQVRQAIEDLPGVQSVEVNRASGSLLVHHDPNLLVVPAIDGPAGLLIDLVPPIERARIVRSSSIVGGCLRLFFGRLDAQVLASSHGWVDLKMLVPLVFLGAAGLQMTLASAGVEFLAPLLLLYAALDLYVKFHELFPGRPAATATT